MILVSSQQVICQWYWDKLHGARNSLQYKEIHRYKWGNRMNDSELTNSRNVEKVELDIKLDCVSLNTVSSTKVFGIIIIHENLKWKNHFYAMSYKLWCLIMG